MPKKIILVGGGGHAKVLIDALQSSGNIVTGIVDPILRKGSTIYGVPILGDDNQVEQFLVNEILLVNGIGSTKSTINRKKVFEKFKAKNYLFSNVIHSSAILSPNIKLSEGVQIMAGVVVQPDCKIQDNVILNTRCSIDHDCVIQSHVHIAPGVTLSGNVNVETGVHVGTGASVIQGINIGAHSIIGAGAVVTEDIISNAVAIGIPARIQ